MDLNIFYEINKKAFGKYEKVEKKDSASRPYCVILGKYRISFVILMKLTSLCALLTLKFLVLRNLIKKSSSILCGRHSPLSVEHRIPKIDKEHAFAQLSRIIIPLTNV